MTRNTLLFGIALLISFGLFGAHGQNTRQVESSSAARFQLYEADWDVIPQKGSTYKAHSVFRIDTSTGATSHIASGTDTAGRYYEKWVLVDESPQTAR